MIELSCILVWEFGATQGGWGRAGRMFQERWVRQWGKYGAQVEYLDRAAIAGLIGSEGYEHGLYDARGGNVQPLSFARGLAHAAISEGATIHGQTKATSIIRSGAGWRVDTEGGGSVSAPYVVIGTNGYTDELWPGLRESVVPVCSFVAATEPLSHNVLATVLPGKHAVSESGRVIVYYRLDRDGRFVIGGHGNWFDIEQTGDDTHVSATAVKLFPQLADVAWEYHWGGWPAMTPGHLPMLMGLAPGVYAGLGYNGRGVASATMMGKQLALAVLGEDPDLEVRPHQKYMFHAFRQIGISWRLLTGTLLDRMRV